ncbi:hypothetical protein [Absidia glauca]|uniref:Cyclin-domain-containing protein n=1 Tax=Absidia glauca TaxID=4829 RepID=A0A168LVI1_ABSGL|nr:hypothetical protein [Absidia glauca]
MPFPIYLDAMSSSLPSTATSSSSCKTSKDPSSATLMERVAYVDALVDMNAMVIEAIWPNTQQKQQGNTSIVPLRSFIQQVLKRSRTTYSTLQTAFFYLFRARPAIMRHLQHSKGDPHIHCGRRMFLASLVVAAKFVQDTTYRNSAWANAAGLPVEEINTAERLFLGLLNYRLYVAQSTFDQWHELLHTHVLAKSSLTDSTVVVDDDKSSSYDPHLQPPSEPTAISSNRPHRQPSLPALSPSSITSTSSSPLILSSPPRKRSHHDTTSPWSHHNTNCPPKRSLQETTCAPKRSLHDTAAPRKRRCPS